MTFSKPPETIEELQLALGWPGDKIMKLLAHTINISVEARDILEELSYETCFEYNKNTLGDLLYDECDCPPCRAMRFLKKYSFVLEVEAEEEK